MEAIVNQRYKYQKIVHLSKNSNRVKNIYLIITRFYDDEFIQCFRFLPDKIDYNKSINISRYLNRAVSLFRVFVGFVTGNDSDRPMNALYKSYYKLHCTIDRVTFTLQDTRVITRSPITFLH